jgi:HEAT repeat protein
MRVRSGVLALFVLLVVAAPAWSRQPVVLRERLLLAEDARAQTDADLKTLHSGLTSRDPGIRRQAVRGIGRLERPELIKTLTRSLADENADVRLEAAHAVGQLARGPTGVTDAKSRLLARSRVEREPRVWGVVAATLGRLAYTTAAEVDEVEAAIARVLPSGAATAIRIDEVLGATEGLEALARQSGKISRLKEATVNGLHVASTLEGRAQDIDKLARIRRFATLALTASGAVQRPQLDSGAADSDEEVRRLTMLAARAEVDGHEAILTRGFVNLIDSPRLDHIYTLDADVVAGMDIVDATVEGDVIERVAIISKPRQ